MSCPRLVDHLVEAGKRAVPLEKHTEKEAELGLSVFVFNYG